MKAKILLPLMTLAFSLNSFAEAAMDSNMDELDPFADNIEETLSEMDTTYEVLTGQASHIDAPKKKDENCFQRTCSVFIDINKATQIAELFLDGALTYTWKVSTGTVGHNTPSFDRHPDGRIYNRYTSTKYPGGDYMGLGNMPFAVFIKGGFAIHGTGKGNWKKLGTRASHGCIRVHPDNAKIFNGLVRQYGTANSWITVR